MCVEVQRSAFRSVSSISTVGSRGQTEAGRLAQREHMLAEPGQQPPPPNKLLRSPSLHLACHFFEVTGSSFKEQN